MAFLPEHIEKRISDEVAARGLVLLELRQRGQRNTTVLEVIVDSETGATLDEITDLSRWVGALLDEVEASLPGRYRLEVSTGGLDRPLEHLWQYRKNVGRLAKLTFVDEEGKTQTEVFRILDVAEDVLTVGARARKGKGEGAPQSMPFERIKRAVIEPEF